MFNTAKEYVDNGIASCVVVKDNIILHKVKGKGIMPLYELNTSHLGDLKSSHVADKIIGRAAAMLLADSSVSFVYGNIISRSAIEILEKYNIPYEYSTLTEKIYNRDKTDLCPMEKTVLETDDAKIGTEKLKEFIRRRDENK